MYVFRERIFLCEYVDGVIIEVMINLNEIVRQINQHISELISRPLVPISNSDDYSTAINQLNWFGIKTADQLNNALIKYSEPAKKIATEKLKHSSAKSISLMHQTVAFFYLCYAILLID